MLDEKEQPVRLAVRCGAGAQCVVHNRRVDLAYDRRDSIFRVLAQVQVQPHGMLRLAVVFVGVGPLGAISRFCHHST